MSDSNRPKYLWKAALKARGWTDGAIKNFLGDPDATRPNPYSKSKPPMLLWEISRVEAAEQTNAFQRWQTETQARRKAASTRMLQIMETKREQTIELFSSAIRRSVQVALQDYNCRHDLEQDAISSWATHREDLRWERGDFTAIRVPSPREVDPGTLRRWICNHVRHRLTNYEYLLSTSKGHVGVEEAYEAMKRVVEEEVDQFLSTHPSRSLTTLSEPIC